MKRLTKVMSVILMAVMITSNMVLAGCTGRAADAAPKALAVILGVHANSQGINFSNIKVQEMVSDAIMSGGFVSIIGNDGDPEIVAANSYEIPEQYANASKSKLRDDAVKKANVLLADLVNVKANDPEVDTLEALDLAIRTFSDLPSDMQKTILIIDTGLSTTGILDFSNNILSADPSAVVDQLMTRKAIPDFSETTVSWLQMGDTAAPQKDLTDAQKDNLRCIWQGIVEATGGTFDYSAAVPVEPYLDPASLPIVSAIDLPGEAPLSFDRVSMASDDAFSDPVILGEDQVKFAPDSDRYVDAKRAEEVLKPVAEYMKSHAELKLALIGTTAGEGNDSYNSELSERRAKAVKDTLVSMGVSEDRLTCRGMGATDPWHIAGAGVEGELAAQNRKVVLLDEQEAASLGLI